MANTLTDLIPDLYAALDKVSRELTGFIPAVGSQLRDTRAAVGEDIIIPITRSNTTSNIAPAMTIPEPTDQTVDNVKVQITKSKSSEFGYVGEEQKGLNNGPGYMSLQAKQIAQAMRAVVNEVEADVAAEAYKSASRAHGTPATTPFGSDLSDLSAVKKILKDNGAPQGDLQLVMDTTAGANLYNLTQLTNVNEAGGDELLRQGLIGARPLNGFSLRETGQGQVAAAASVTGTVTVTGANAIGATTVNLTTAAASGVTVVAGQFITFAGDTNKYVVAEDATIGASTTGDVVIAKPGLLVATSGSEAVTGSGAFSANVAFDRDAIQLVTRAPAMPEEGDARLDSTIIQDPMSGLAFEVVVWGGYRKIRYEVGLAWGQKGIKPEHTVNLLG